VPGIEPGTSGSVARNSDHQTTEAVRKQINGKFNNNCSSDENKYKKTIIAASSSCFRS
jgi:hypothetical protein